MMKVVILQVVAVMTKEMTKSLLLLAMMTIVALTSRNLALLYHWVLVIVKVANHNQV